MTTMMLSHLTGLQCLGMLLLFMGWLLRHFIWKRRFHRRFLGYESFDTYYRQQVNKYVEALVLLMAFILRISGYYLLLIEWINKHF